MPQTPPIISGGVNAWRLPAFFESMSHSNVILVAGCIAFGHKDGPKQVAISCGKGENVWMQWEACQCGDVSLSDNGIAYAETHGRSKAPSRHFRRMLTRSILDGRIISATLSSRICRPPYSIERRRRSSSLPPRAKGEEVWMQ